MKRIKHLFTALLLLLSVAVNAHSFVLNGIYYNITDATNKTVAVTYKGSSFDAYSNEYTGSVVIPESVAYNGNTYSVTSIGDYAFYYCSGLTSIVIPNSVTSIGRVAFCFCDGLTSVLIPNSVTSIGRSAFEGCSRLKSVTIPNSVTSIGEIAFYKCSDLTSVVIGNSVTSIGYDAFSDCSGLTSVVVADGNAKYDSRENCNAIIEKETNTLVVGCKNTIIPNSVTSIGERAFRYCSGLKRIVIPNSVTSIGENAFNGCTSLKDLRIEDGENTLSLGYNSSVGKGLFYDSPLKTLYLGRNLSYNTNYGYSPFYNKSSLTSVTIGNSVTSIGSYAFRGCSGLTSIEIPNSVTSIGNHAFENCSGLTSIVVEEGNTIYDSRDNCNAIIETSTNTLIVGCKSTVIPNSVTSIGNYAFEDCSGLTSIEIPNSVTSIRGFAFYYCSGLTSIEIPNSVTSIGGSAFYGCSALKTVINYSSLIIEKGSSSNGSVGYYADNIINGSIEGDFVFNIIDGVNTLVEYLGYDTQIVLPENYSKGKYAIGEVFKNNTSITSIVISNSVTSIGDDAFRGCSNLKTVINLSSLSITKGDTNNGYVGYYADNIINAPNGTIEGEFVFSVINSVNTLAGYIGNYTEIVLPENYSKEKYAIGEVFKNNTSITSIVIPNSVTSIGSSAFEGCSGLKKVELNCATIDSWFRGNESIEEIIIGDSVTSIGNHAFEGCSGLTSVVIGNSVTSIGSSAFEGCSGLKKVELNCATIDSWFRGNESIEEIIIGDSVTSIGNHAFENCSGLTSVTIGNSVTSIGWDAFKGCSGLTSIVIPNSVTNIGYAVFKGCSGLTSVTIGNSVTSIGSSAFEGCSGLKKVELNCATIDSWFRGNESIEEIIIGDSVTNIGYAVFEGCSGLTGELVIPNSVTSIGDYAFKGCSGLTSVTIGNSVTSIGWDAFKGCGNLKTVFNCSSLPITKGSNDNGYVGYYAEKVINAPNGTIEGDFAFVVIDGVNTLVEYLGNDTEIVLPQNYKGGSYVIGAEAFYNNTSITSIEIPNSVTSIGDYAFDDCSGLTAVYINDLSVWCNIDFANYFSNPLYYAKNLYLNGELVTDLVIPDGVTEIKKYAFEGCSGLTSIVIPNSVTSIGNYAFYNCSGLKTVINYSNLNIEKGSTSYGYIAYYAEIVGPSISLDKTTATIIEGETETLVATVTPADATEQTVAWTTSDASIATVEGGVVTAVKAGTATITATAGGYSATCVVTVEQKVIAVTGISLDKTTATIIEGETETLTATVIPSNATDQTVIWTTSDASIATVEGGVVTAVKAGTATITATAGNYSATCVVTVEKKVIAVTGISLNKTTATIIEGETETLVATVAPSTATDQTVIWTTSDASIATVSNGVVTAVKAGTATITATAGSNSATCVVTVEAKEEPEEPAGLISGINYRIKHNTTGYYMTVVSTESNNHDAGGVQIKTLDKNELDQVFILESVAENSYKIKSINGYYLSSFASWGYKATVSNSDAAIHQFTEVEEGIYTLSGNLGYIGSNSDDRGGKEEGAWIYSNHGSNAQNIYWVFETLTAEENKGLVALQTAEAMNSLERSIAWGKEIASSRAAVLSDEEKTSINKALRTAENEKGNTEEDVDVEIARLNALSESIYNAVENAIYIWSIDDISNTVCYTVSTENSGSWYSETSQLNSTKKLGVAYAVSDSKQQFAFVKSAKSGKYYLYSVGEEKFVAINGSHTTLAETPEMGIVFLNGTRSAAYPWVVAFDTVNGEKQISVSNGYDPGVITFWNNLSDSGNTVRFEKAAMFDAAAALSLVEGYESESTCIEAMDGVVETVYDLNGRRIVDTEHLEHGVYIVNGKKVVK